jgi:predicted GNAT family acetyltransferase
MVTTADGRPMELLRDTEGRRFRASVAGEVIAEAEFLLTPELMVFTHTEVNPAFEGQGVGSALIRWALEDARTNGYAVLPSCPFVRAYVGRHADEYADLVYHAPGGTPAS